MRFSRPLRNSAAAIEETTADPCGSAVEILRAYWGYEQFRPLQLETICTLMRGRDALAVLPTGGGKSLTYQVPALLGSGLVIVVSPLISLMEDQVRALSDRGIPAWCLSGDKSSTDIRSICAAAGEARAGLLYVSPERLMANRFRSALRSLRVSLLAVDEAHCISEWGHEFRPSYRTIPAVYEVIRRPPVLAVTATATPRVMRDISRRLDLRSPKVFAGNTDRPNIVFSVFRTAVKRRMVDEILRRVAGTAIVYAQTRRSVEAWTTHLNACGWPATFYHGGMSNGDRMRAQRAWQEGSVRIMVATNAFGMGIDKPDVRSVIHVGLPLSLEGYYQEAGRAGRDGKKAYATLLFDHSDLQRHEDMRSGERPSLRRRVVARFGGHGPVQSSSRRLGHVLSYARSQTCRRRRLLGHFGRYSMADCGTCDVCLGRHAPLVAEPKWEAATRAILTAISRGDVVSLSEGIGNLPAYRVPELIHWMVRHGYLELADDPSAGPSVTPLGLQMLRRAERGRPEHGRKARHNDQGHPDTVSRLP